MNMTSWISAKAQDLFQLSSHFNAEGLLIAACLLDALNLHSLVFDHEAMKPRSWVLKYRSNKMKRLRQDSGVSRL
jgi:hypothetical protein